MWLLMLVAAANVPLELRLVLDSRYQLHAKSPTALAVYRAKQKIVSFDTKALEAGAAKVPALAPGKYQVRGPVYFCKKEGPSFCVKRNVEKEVVVQPEAPDRVIEVAVTE